MVAHARSSDCDRGWHTKIARRLGVSCAAPAGLYGPPDLYGAHVRVAHVDVVVGDRAATLWRMWKSFRLPQLTNEGHADDVRSGVGRDAHLETRIAGELHVPFPLGIAGKARLAIARITERGRPALRVAADSEALHQLSVEAHVELLWPPHAFEVVLILALQANLDEVLAVDREVVRNRDAAARAKRQILALPVVLEHVDRDLECLDARARRRQTGCACA